MEEPLPKYYDSDDSDDSYNFDDSDSEWEYAQHQRYLDELEEYKQNIKAAHDRLNPLAKELWKKYGPLVLDQRVCTATINSQVYKSVGACPCPDHKGNGPPHVSFDGPELVCVCYNKCTRCRHPNTNNLICDGCMLELTKGAVKP